MSDIIDPHWKRPATAPVALDPAAVSEIVGPITNAEEFDRLAGVTTLDAPHNHHLVFLDRFDPELIAQIEACRSRGMLFALPPSYRDEVSVAAVFSEFPREVLSRLVAALFDYERTYWDGFEDSAAAEARMPGVRILPGCQIHRSAMFGPGSKIFPGNVIGPNVSGGERTLIRPSSAIGFAGYGIYRGSAKRNLHLPHVGGVIIGDDVEIGSFNTVCSGTIHPTVIETDTKLDDHVHVAHNCHIGHGVRVTAHVELSGSVVVERDAWLAPNISIIEGARIGTNSLVGIGSTVVRDVPANTMVVGSPARPLRTLTPND